MKDKEGVMLMSSAEEKTGDCCARLVVCVKKGKVSVFDDNRFEEELVKKRHARLTRYAAKLNKLDK